MTERVVVVAGPSGCGKSTVGAMAAHIAEATFFEADDFHADDAKAAMASGRGLTDAARRPWLERLAAAVRRAAPDRAVIACSALNPTLRGWLGEGLPGAVDFVMLDVPAADLARRLDSREGHFVGTALLSSQLDAMDERGTILLDGTQAPAILAERVAALFTGASTPGSRRSA